MLNPLGLDYLVFLDWESYYDTEYSLRKLTYIEYIQSPKFKEHGISIQINSAAPIWYHTKKSMHSALMQIPWIKAGLVGHNLHFDGLIAALKYKIYPKMYIDTLGMARAILPTLQSHSLSFLADYLGLGEKNPKALDDIKGILKPDKDQLAALGRYCNDDVTLTYELYQKLAGFLPLPEYESLDQTIRMQTQPQFILDRDRLDDVIDLKLKEREDTLKEAETNITTVRSSAKLAEAFRELAVEPPTKISPRTNKETYAFAKTDLGMQKLVNDPDPKVAALAKARLSCMSNLDIRRAERFQSIHDCNNGYLPVTLNYYGAHTGRWSGGDKTNVQNLTKKSPLRSCLMAPPGYLVLAADQSQIEARITAWLAEHFKLLNDFKLNDEGISPYDVYQIMASHIYGIALDKIDDAQRFIGKMCVLGLGYGMGVEKLYTVLQQILGAGKIEKWEVQNMVDVYRKINYPIVMLWKTLDKVLSDMIHQRDGVYKCISYDAGSIKLPNDMFLQYPFLNATANDWGGVAYEYEFKGKIQNIYGGRLTENIVQALARSVIADNMRAIQQRYRVATMTHDEIVILPPKSEIDDAEQFVTEIMTTAPEWAADLPLAIEVDIDDRYAKS